MSKLLEQVLVDVRELAEDEQDMAANALLQYSPAILSFQTHNSQKCVAVVPSETRRGLALSSSTDAFADSAHEHRHSQKSLR